MSIAKKYMSEHLDPGSMFPEPEARITSTTPKKKITTTAAPNVVLSASTTTLVAAANPEGIYYQSFIRTLRIILN